MKLKTLIANIMLAASILFFVWLGVSWVDIVADNHTANPTHSPYNFFVVMFGGTEDV